MTTFPHLTYWEVAFAVLANQLCLPVPSVFVLMGAGALCARGELSFGTIVFLAVLACLTADSIWYLVGHRWGTRTLAILCSLAADPRRVLREARAKFHGHGLRVLFFSKFVPGLDGIMPPLTGAEKVSYPAFLAFDAGGSFLWSSLYTGAGFLLSRQLEEAVRWAGQFGTALGILLGVSIGLCVGWLGIPLLRMIRRLRHRRITASTLAAKLTTNRRIAVLDLLQFESESETGAIEAIPGACSIDPSVLHEAERISVPDDIEIILYCSAGSDAVSARAALALQRVGIDKVWVLEGGLKAWREQQLPVSSSLEVPEQLAARLGIELPEVKRYIRRLRNP